MIKIDFDPSPRVVSQFAWVAVAGLGLLAYLGLRWTVGFSWDHPVFLGAIALGVLQLVLFLIGVRVVSRILFVTLSIVFVPIGFIISHVLIAVIYYVVLTPIALVFRLTGRDVLGRRPDPAKTSYWHQRDGARSPASYFKLY